MQIVQWFKLNVKNSKQVILRLKLFQSILLAAKFS